MTAAALQDVTRTWMKAELNLNVPNLLSRWHQLQLKLIWELVQVLQLVNWRQAGEGKGQQRSGLRFETNTSVVEMHSRQHTVHVLQPTPVKPEASAVIWSYLAAASSPRRWSWWSWSWSAPHGGTRRWSSASRLLFREQRKEEEPLQICHSDKVEEIWMRPYWGQGWGLYSICTNYTTPRPVLYVCLWHFGWMSVCAAVTQKNIISNDLNTRTSVENLTNQSDCTMCYSLMSGTSKLKYRERPKYQAWAKFWGQHWHKLNKKTCFWISKYCRSKV